MRSEFEKTKTYDLCKSWQIDFDEERQYYYSINPVIHADVTAINSAWRMFQEQQSKVDELQKRVDAALKLIPSIKAENDLWGCDQVERQIELLEQALKGEQP